MVGPGQAVSPECDRLIKLAFFRERWDQVVKRFCEADFSLGAMPGHVCVGHSDTSGSSYVEMLAFALNRLAGGTPPDAEAKLKSAFLITPEAWAEYLAGIHQRRTEVNATFVAVLERSLPLAVSEEVRQRVRKNIEIGRGNLNLKILQPVVAALGAIRESGPLSSVKFAGNQQEILPRLEDLARSNFQQQCVALREKFNLTHDVLRHTFISMFVAKFRSIGEAAIQAGNSEGIIRRHYLDLKSKEEAEQFFGILPQRRSSVGIVVLPVPTERMPVAV